MMNALDLAQLKRIDRQADIAIAGKPAAMMLVVRLVAIIDAVLLNSVSISPFKPRLNTLLVIQM